MSITYNWTINNLGSTVADGVVFVVNYEFTATDGTYLSGIQDFMDLNPPAEGDTIIPYSDLTEETVINWVKERIGDEIIAEWKTEFEEDLVRQSTVQNGKPWES